MYVAAKKGFLSGVIIMVRGQPPEPVIIWQKVMYRLSTSGLSSLSTFMQTNMGLSSSFALAKASSPQGYQSTGLFACFNRYGLFSSESLFIAHFNSNVHSFKESAIY